MTVFLLSLILGLFSGLAAGLFGVGGGLVIVPILVLVLTAEGFPAELVMIMSVATSLATIIVTSIASVVAHHRLGSVMWEKVLGLGPGIIVGAALGAVVADNLDADVLRSLFIVFLLFVGMQMAFQFESRLPSIKHVKTLDFAVAGIIGIVSSILGIGGGTLTVPFLVSSRQPMQKAVATASACGLPIAVFGTLSYALLGTNEAQLPDWSLGYVYVPAFFGIALSSIFSAPIGARLAHRLPAKQLKRYFSLLLFVMAAKMIWY